MEVPKRVRRRRGLHRRRGVCCGVFGGAPRVHNTAGGAHRQAVLTCKIQLPDFLLLQCALDESVVDLVRTRPLPSLIQMCPGRSGMRWRRCFARAQTRLRQPKQVRYAALLENFHRGKLSMKAVRFHQTGGPEVLTYEDVPDVTPGDGEVLIRVEAVGMNFADVMRRRGDPYPEPSPPPFTLGIEVAGTVAAVGKGVTSFQTGSPVFAMTRSGGYAQYACAPATAVVPMPSGMSAAQATTLVVQGLTAALSLRKSARLMPGESGTDRSCGRRSWIFRCPAGQAV